MLYGVKGSLIPLITSVLSTYYKIRLEFYRFSPITNTHYCVFRQNFTILSSHTFISSPKSSFIVARFHPSKRTTNVKNLRRYQFYGFWFGTFCNRQRFRILQNFFRLFNIPVVRKFWTALFFQIIQMSLTSQDVQTSVIFFLLNDFFSVFCYPVYHRVHFFLANQKTLYNTRITLCR